MVRAWDVPRLFIAYIRLTIFKNIAVLKGKIPITGNYREYENMGSKHSQDATSYKITITVSISR